MGRKGFYLIAAGIVFLACNAQKSVDPGGGSYVPIGTERTEAIDQTDTVEAGSSDTLKKLPDTIGTQRPE